LWLRSKVSRENKQGKVGMRLSHGAVFRTRRGRYQKDLAGLFQYHLLESTRI
jgi:hypothetical protein